MPRYPVAVENPETGWSEWIQPAADYRLACCDCGLVHQVEFRVHDGRIQFRAQRNNRATGQKRRRRHTSR